MEKLSLPARGVCRLQGGRGPTLRCPQPFRGANEAQTEQDLIRQVLELLGWADYLPQQGTARNEDIPDHLLFVDAGSKGRAAAEGSANARYRHAAVVEESKRFGLPLDARDGEDRLRTRTPHGQILRYLSTAEIESESRIRWGILTNGGVWRLYDYRARPRASGYYEADLATLLDSGREDELRVFHLLLRRESFVRQQGSTATFLETALAEGRRYEEQVAQDLSGVVFESVFPGLVNALAEKNSERSLAEIRDAALIFLYRLLFVLYAEDRGLLPVNDRRYDDYGLRKRVRDDIARRMADGDAYSGMATNYYDRLVNLFRIVDAGDQSIGLPPYNGGLFATEAAPLLEETRLSDAVIAPIIYALSHANDPRGERRFVNYRDMSVQQLGSIYERLLERQPVRLPAEPGDTGEIVIRPNPYARKDSGSFFTPQELVDLLVDRTLKPLVEERLKAFEEKAAQLRSDSRPRDRRKAELLELDPAEAVLDLKVLDPAMGSGHFLVTAVDFLSDYIAELIEYVPAVPEWLDGYVFLAPRPARRPDPAGHPQTGGGVQLGPGEGAAHRSGHHPPHGPQALHLWGGQEPPHRGIGQGVVVAAQLHRRGPALFPRPPPALRRLARRSAGLGGDRRPAKDRRSISHERHRRSRGRHPGDAAHRGPLRRRHR